MAKKAEYGLANEKDAVNSYVRDRNVNVYRCGLVIDPSCPHLGATPDGKIYDPSENPPFGLIELKCPLVDSVNQCQCLKKNNGILQLKSSHQYYYQIMGQMALSGLRWCDFIVWTPNDMHIERIKFDCDVFSGMKMKLDLFYFEYYIPLFLSEK